MKGGLQQLMKQAQQMQTKIAKMQEELADLEVEASVGGGMVTATATCSQKLVSIKIDPEVIDPEDGDMLQDLIVAAVNEAMRMAEEKKQEELGKLMPAGMGGLPGMGGLGNLF